MLIKLGVWTPAAVMVYIAIQNALNKGRTEITEKVIRMESGLDEEQVRRGLDQLVENDIIIRRTSRYATEHFILTEPEV
jgi:transcription initiation factor IIE alpha subunit